MNKSGLNIYSKSNIIDMDHSEMTVEESLPSQRRSCRAAAWGESWRSHPAPLHTTSCSGSERGHTSVNLNMTSC